jgi:hypothetical protein
MERLVEVLTSFLYSLVNFLPNAIGAVIILLIGLAVGSGIGRILKSFLKRYRVDERFIKKPVFKFSEIFPNLVSWTIYLFFIWAAFEFLAIETLLIPIRIIFSFLPRLIEAIIIVLAGYGIAEYVRQQVEKSKFEFSWILARVFFFFIVYVAIVLALPLVDIDVSLLNNILLIIVGSFGLGIAIALGLGLKDIIAEEAKNYLKKFRKRD